MKVIGPEGTFDLGVTEATPTISIQDYSRREPDEFGETIVVERGFSRRLSVRLLVPSANVDALQQHLAGLRATSATWVADEASEWLSPVGFFKDFEVDFAVPPTSYCTLSIEGLAETEVAADPGGDPAPAGSVSTLRIVDAGDVFALGLTEASPSIGITDYSRKEFDEFGDADIVERAWAKRMTMQALIRTEMIDVVANRIAAVRARPVQWVADDEYQSLQIEGFFKQFSIERGETVSRLSLDIEGLSTAPPPSPGFPIGATPEQIEAIEGNTGNAIDNIIRLERTDEALADTDRRALEIERQVIPRIETSLSQARTDAANALARIASEVTRIDQRIDIVAATNDDDSNNEYDALRVEVSRVDTASLGRDAALGERVDLVSAGLTNTESSLLAKIRTIETAAVDRDAAISQRIDSITAEGGEGATDIFARSEISRIETAFISADTAFAERADRIETRLGNVQASVTSTSSALATLDETVASHTQTIASQGASIQTLQQAISDPDTDYAALTQTVEAQGVTIQQHTSALSSTAGNISTLFARASLTLSVDGYVTGWETSNNGNVGNFTIHADNFAIVKPGGGARTEFSGGNWRIYDANGVLRVRLGVW